MNVGYYPGCSLESTAKEFDHSFRTICKGYGIELTDIPDWNCCGASPAHQLSEELAFALPYRNLLKAEEGKLTTVVSPCPACYSHLIHTHKAVEEKPELGSRLSETVGHIYKGSVSSKHLLDFLYHDIGLQRIQECTKKPLEGLRVVNYYGCLTRLPGVEIGSAENPTMMDDIVLALGAEPLPWSHKTECCGASLSITRTDIGLRLANELLDAARDVKADCIAVVCPLCQSNLDMRQPDVERKYHRGYGLPIIYLSQLIGLTMEMAEKDLGLEKLVVDPTPLLKAKGIL
ncbi:MAG: heterodisulfide reductase subunit B [Proteobacteria bacterium]|nr:heterodisulfide reductase subunit B [Pseudomonadota bacterium]